MITIIYTFDTINTTDDNYLMLKISIYTVLRELNDFIHEIRVYTNTPELLEYINKNRKVKIIKFHNHYFKNIIKNAHVNQSLKLSYFRIIGDNYGISHARTFLIHEVMTETKSDILYLDHDTGISKGWGEKVIALLKKCEILTDAIDNRCIKTDIINNYNFIKKYNIEWIPENIIRYCMGIAYFKYNEKNLKITKDIQKNYEIITKNIGFLILNDEYAINSSLYQHNTTPYYLHNDVYYNNYKNNDIILNNNTTQYGLVHYSSQKTQNNDTFKIMLSNWKMFFDNESINIINHSNVNTKPYDFPYLFLWGKFETL